MSNLVAVAYPDEATATEVGSTLVELQKEHLIELEDLVVAVKADGKIKLRQSFNGGAAGAAGGALWGGLIGLIFLVPLLGMAVGAAAGGAAGSATDDGIDDKFMKELGDRLQPGGAALFVLVRSSTPDKVLPRHLPVRRRGPPLVVVPRGRADAPGRAGEGSGRLVTVSEIPEIGRNWWLFLVVGLVSIIAGILAIVYPDITLLALGIIVGVGLLFSGGIEIAEAIAGRP